MDEKPETRTTEARTPGPKRRTAPDPRTFYVVWSPEGGDPVVRFPGFAAARNAAWRLSEKYPGQGFFVLKSCWGRLARPAEIPVTPGEAGAGRGGPDEAGPG
jgi:hypothetical protein